MPALWGRSRRHKEPSLLEPLHPRLKWRAITLATLVLVPAVWSILVGLVAVEARDPNAPDPGLFLALGLSLIPFVFIVLAFLSEHPRAPTAVLKAMGLTLLVGIPISALAGDAITGLVAGIGCGGTAALRMDRSHRVRDRLLAVLVASIYAFVLARIAGPAALLTGPILPFTALGIADHLAERRLEDESGGRSDGSSEDSYDG